MSDMHLVCDRRPISVRCKRAQFTGAQYTRYEQSFWPMPTRWATLSESRLAHLWRRGGAGAVSILPILGQFANSDFADALWLSFEELARLGGVSAKTAAAARRVLKHCGLAEAETGVRNGKRAAKWKLSPRLAVPKDASPEDGAYFYFAARLIYGGNWRQLTPVQRALYLAVGAQARTFHQRPADNGLLRSMLSPDVELTDFDLCYDFTNSANGPDAQSPEGWLRLAYLSIRELSLITGIAESAVHRAVAGLKHPHNWPGSQANPEALRYCPLAVYPTTGGSLIYHLRDHAPHWPFEVLNESRRPRMREVPLESIPD